MWTEESTIFAEGGRKGQLCYGQRRNPTLQSMEGNVICRREDKQLVMKEITNDTIIRREDQKHNWWKRRSTTSDIQSWMEKWPIM